MKPRPPFFRRRGAKSTLAHLSGTFELDTSTNAMTVTAICCTRLFFHNRRDKSIVLIFLPSDPCHLPIACTVWCAGCHTRKLVRFRVVRSPSSMPAMLAQIQASSLEGVMAGSETCFAFLTSGKQSVRILGGEPDNIKTSNKA